MPATLREVRSLLDELVPLRSNTTKGQDDIVNWVIDYVRQRSIGDAKKVPYPKGTAAADKRPKLSNVIVDIGNPNADELVIWEGHLDTVERDEGYDNLRKRKAYEVHPADPDSRVCYGLGINDMLLGIASMLIAAERMKLHVKRRIRLLLVTKEEDESQGIKAARQGGLLDGASCAITTEIPVRGTLQDKPGIIIGRPGRVELEVTIWGHKTHMGGIEFGKYEHLAWWRDCQAKDIVSKIVLPHHPQDTYGILPHPLCGPSCWKSKGPKCLSVADTGRFNVDVLYTHPSLTPEDIRNRVRSALEDRLGKGLHVALASRRITPYTQPWLERVDGPFTQNMLSLAKHVVSENDLGEQATLRGGRGTADEYWLGVPTVTIPHNGEGEHTHKECADLLTAVNYQIPMLEGAAAYRKPLNQ